MLWRAAAGIRRIPLPDRRGGGPLDRGLAAALAASRGLMRGVPLPRVESGIRAPGGSVSQLSPGRQNRDASHRRRIPGAPHRNASERRRRRLLLKSPGCFRLGADGLSGRGRSARALIVRPLRDETAAISLPKPRTRRRGRERRGRPRCSKSRAPTRNPLETRGFRLSCKAARRNSRRKCDPPTPGVVPCVKRVASPQSPRGSFPRGPSPYQTAGFFPTASTRQAVSARPPRMERCPRH